MTHSCEMHTVVCPQYRPAVPEDGQCESPARCSMELPCFCEAGMHTVWLCPNHYDWRMEIQNLAKEVFGGIR